MFDISPITLNVFFQARMAPGIRSLRDHETCLVLPTLEFNA
jgi:hypothetical protein